MASISDRFYQALPWVVGVGIGAIALRAIARARRTWPVVPYRGILSAFGSPRTTSGNRRHAGVDLQALAGDKVVAIDDGEVIGLVTGYEIRAGLGAVAVRHPDADYIYAEIEVAVKPGARVRAGEPIGVVRKNADGNQMLHLEAWETGTVPEKFTPWYVGKPMPAGLIDVTKLLPAA